MSESPNQPGTAVNLAEKFELLDAQWSPRIVAELNNIQFKIARLEGEFVWHAHADTDEAFFVVDGELQMEFRDRSETVRAGELIVVPRGVEHRPVASRECRVMLVEPRGTVNTGAEGGERTAPDAWL